jgi:hypothetical protein
MGGRRGVGSWTARLGWLQAALLEAAARARGGGRLANRGGRRGRQWLGCKREREREREATQRWGADMWARATQCRAAWFNLDLNLFKI